MTKIRFPFLVALFGALVFAFASVANAETIAAVTAPQTAQSIGWTGQNGTVATLELSCVGADRKISPWNLDNRYWMCGNLAGTSSIYLVNPVCPAGFTPTDPKSGNCTGPTTTTCPTGQNWTLSAQTCTRPDCVAPETRDPLDGVCKNVDPCAGKETQPPVTGWYPSAVGTPSLESSQYCDGGCAAALNASPTGTQYANKTTRWQQYSKVQLGYTCTAGLPTAPISGEPNKQPPEPPKKPPCLAAEGVLTSSTGAVHCVPEGTPGAAPPVVTKTKDVQNFPDGSTKTTETTTTRDAQTGAEVKGQIITVTPATGGGAGAAGTPGTTSGTEEKGTTTGGDPTKPGDSDFCAKNPGLQVCKGGMNEEATQKEIKDKLTEINESLNPEDDANKEGLEAEKTGYEEKATAHKEFLDAFAAKGQNDEGFLSWAMIPEVPSSSCSPFTGTIAGRAIELDWCEKLGMVREMAGYMFYLLTAFGLFRIFANSTGATS